MTLAVRYVDYRPAGAIRQLWKQRQPELLVEGPANCGKTRGILEWCNYLCETYPGIRQLWVRQTRKSLTESVLVTWEEHVLWPGHPAIVGEAHRGHRDFYEYPNGSYIVLGGMDHPDRFMSAEYDVIVFFEATEGTLEGWEKVTTRLRNKKMPWQPAVADCNPGAESHWLNQRANAGKMQRLIVRHDSNPIFTEQDRARLEALTGARRKRLLDGLWVSEEGQIWEEYDSALHIVDQPKKEAIRWYFGSYDWGFRKPSCLQVWGVDGDERLYRVAEVYRRGRQLEWWAEVVAKLYAEFPMRQIACDHEPDIIEKFNDRLGVVRGRDVPRIAIEANKDVSAGLDQVRWALSKDEQGKPRMFFCRDALRFGRDEELAAAYLPCSTEEEIPSYVWLKAADGKPVKELPDPICEDHGCDATRYAAMYAWRRDPVGKQKPGSYAPGTYGALLGLQPR